MNDLLLAYNTNFAKQRKDPSHHFEIGYRSRKAPQQSIYIRARTYNTNKGIPYGKKLFGSHTLPTSKESLPDHLDHDARLIRTRLGHYYLAIPMPLERADDNQVRPQHQDGDRIIALDPGVRTFQTGYDPSGSVVEVGKGDIGHIYRLCHRMDRLQSRIDSDPLVRHRKRYRMRVALRRMRLRLRNLVDECHKKLVSFLVRNYDVILLPTFETSQMVVKNARRIRSKTARAMLTWSFYRFKQRLLFKRKVSIPSFTCCFSTLFISFLHCSIVHSFIPSSFMFKGIPSMQGGDLY